MNHKLTIVLVTQPGRESFFQSSLIQVTQALLTYEGLSVVLILNGQSAESSRLAKKLQDRFLNRITLIFFEENFSLPGRTWEALSDLGLKWVHFPGDDDLIVPSAYREFFNFQKLESVGAIAFNAECIDVEDRPLGRTLKPSINKSSGFLGKDLLRAFHEPPFVWPALILDFEIIPTPVFQSRYVFDWWVSLHLISKKNWVRIEQTLVHYRIHAGQESQLMPDTRKRFEAMLMLSDFLDQVFLRGEKESTFSLELGLPFSDSSVPIYGDTLFGGYILWRLLSVSNFRLFEWSSQIDDEILEWGRLINVPLLSTEIPYRLVEKLELSELSTNFFFELDNDCCNTVRDVYQGFTFKFENRVGLLKCLHSRESESKMGVVEIDCSLLSSIDDKRQRTAFLMKQILESSHLDRGTLSLSSHEQRIIKLFRKFKTSARNLKRLLSR